MAEPLLPITDADVTTFTDAYETAYLGGSVQPEVADPDDYACERGLTAVAAVRDRRVAAQALRDAYWKLRERASGYRGTYGFQAAQDRRRANPTDVTAVKRAVLHEWFARGIESAAAEVAALLGVAEHELDPPVDGPTVDLTPHLPADPPAVTDCCPQCSHQWALHLRGYCEGDSSPCWCGKTPPRSVRETSRCLEADPPAVTFAVDPDVDTPDAAR